MRELIWSDEARYDLSAIIEFIEERNEAASQRMRSLIETGAKRALQFPFAFRSGRVSGTREAVVHPKHLIVFGMTDANIRVLSVLHVRQQYP